MLGPHRLAVELIRHGIQQLLARSDSLSVASTLLLPTLLYYIRTPSITLDLFGVDSLTSSAAGSRLLTP